jgi:hypothetical protein
MGLAFAALFALGMAVQYRAGIVRWDLLAAALQGESPVRIATTPPAAAPAAATSPAASAQAGAAPTALASGAPAAQPAATAGFSPLMPSPLPRPGAPLPPPVPSLMDRAPAPHAQSRLREADAAPRDGNPNVDVELRSSAPPRREVNEDNEVVIRNPKALDTDKPRSSPDKSSPAPAYRPVTTNGGSLVLRDTTTNKFVQLAPGERLPNGQTLLGIDEAHGTFTTNAGTFTTGDRP